ncbi:MAG: ABC transporter permease [Acidimicrobiales bacterium]
MNAFTKAIAIAGTNLRRLFRDRSNIFFVFIFPIALVLVLGTVFGGGFEPTLGVVAPRSDPQADDVVASLRADDDMDVRSYDSVDELLGAVERGNVNAGVVIPDDFGDALSSGDDTTIGFLARPDGVGPQLQSTVQASVGPQAERVRSARFATDHGAGPFEPAITRAVDLQASLPKVTVRTSAVGEALFPESLGRFDLGASSQLLLFMFITGITGSAALIQTRQLGVSRRMLATPTAMGTVLAGEALGRFAVVAFQGLYIMAATWLVFGVNWGDPVGALALVVAFGAVAAAVAMLLGSVFRNDQQASGVGVVVGLGLGALGGSMTPLELFSPTLRRIAHATPHAWAGDGFAELVREGGGVVDILPELGVLAAMAAVVAIVATRRLRAALTA